jgi:cytochrome c oxidase subunit 2
MTSPQLVAPLCTAVVAVAVLLLAACGTDGAAGLDLSPAGEAGRQIAEQQGCASCHGVNGEGKVGPPFTGLFGSTVQLDDGSTTVADEAYLIESIKDPQARKVDGYALPMPETNLSDEQIASIVDFIRELSEPAGSATSGP